MKTHCTAFLGLLPPFSSNNTLKPAGLPKPRVLRCRDAIKRSIANAQFDSFSLVWYILAQYIIPYFKGDISSFPTADRVTQICLYKFAALWLTGRVAKFKIKKNRLNVCCIYSHQLTQQLTHDKVQDVT